VNLLRKEYGTTGPIGPTGPTGPAQEEEYFVRMTGPTGPAGPIETTELSNKEIEKHLKGLMLAFENSSTPHYLVKKAKTSMVLTKNAEGKLQVSLGLGVFKLFDANGNVTSETRQGIEIEIECRESGSNQ